MNKKQKLFLAFLILFIVVLLGASCIQDAVVPCEIDKKVLEYTGEKSTMYAPWTTIHDARRVQRAMEYVHLTKQEAAKRLSEDDNMFYDYINNAMTVNFENAQQIKDIVFDPTGPLAALLIGLPCLGLGRYLKSPREQELEKKLNGNA